MKTAICLFGISRQEYSRHGSSIDYRKSLQNYRDYLFPYFLSKGQVEIYLCTNIVGEKELEELIQDYSPISIECIDNIYDIYTSRNKKITSVVKKVLESKKIYDLICVTRFDLHFMEPLEKANLDLTRMNIVSILEEPTAICDNFYLFPGFMLSSFYETLIACPHKGHHWIKNEIEKNIQQDIHFIKDEQCIVADLSFYKIVR